MEPLPVMKTGCWWLEPPTDPTRLMKLPGGVLLRGSTFLCLMQRQGNRSSWTSWSSNHSPSAKRRWERSVCDLKVSAAIIWSIVQCIYEWSVRGLLREACQWKLVLVSQTTLYIWLKPYMTANRGHLKSCTETKWCAMKLMETDRSKYCYV